MLKKDLVLQNDELKCNSFKRSFELTDVSYSVSGIQDYFKYIFKKNETVADNPSIMIYVNKIENRNTFKKRQDIILSCERLKQ